MSDANYKPKAARTSQGLIDTILVPAIVGAAAASLLMQVVPEMFMLTNQGTPALEAFPQAVVSVWDRLYSAAFLGGDINPLGWPGFGMIGGIFLFHLYNLSER